MPSFVHNVRIISTSVSSTINNGDTFLIAPVSDSKTYYGSGSSNTGDMGTTLNVRSLARVADKDIVDHSVLKGKNKS
ncbi:spore germination protein [Gordoniibacillus kamchatkensis]|uniref:spore germination protein n=1 Tax=Gordoniibacillus kamchatkensis TaxID=1590651 RepID=UPI0009E2183C